MRVFPKVVSKVVTHMGGWIVGSAAVPNVEFPARDIDVVVPFSHWHLACQLIPSSAVVNSFGGFKFDDEGTMVDMWPCDFAQLMLDFRVKCIWHPATDTRFVREKTIQVKNVGRLEPLPFPAEQENR